MITEDQQMIQDHQWVQDHQWPTQEWQPVSGDWEQTEWPQQEWHRIIGRGVHAFPGRGVELSVLKQYRGAFYAEVTRDGVVYAYTSRHKTEAAGKRWADMYYHCFVKDTL